MSGTAATGWSPVAGREGQAGVVAQNWDAPAQHFKESSCLFAMGPMLQSLLRLDRVVAASVSPSTGRFDKLKVPSLSRDSGP